MTTLTNVIDELPPVARDEQRSQAERFAWQLDILARHTPIGGTVVDIGGGYGTFSVGAAAMGYRAIIIDDGGDPAFFDAALMAEMNRVYAKYNVDLIIRDVVREPLGFPPHSLDMVTSFDSIEHWHTSPKRMLHDVVNALKPGGWFFLGAPNCVNLRKRITVPLGRGKWTSMAQWYEPDVFRSHVREPDVDDLRYIARDMGLTNVQIYGRNWQGYYSTNRITRAVTPFVDRLLRPFPTLCSDIYVLGQRPA